MKNDCLYSAGYRECHLVSDYEILQEEFREAGKTYYTLLAEYRNIRNELDRVRNILSKYGIPNNEIYSYEISGKGDTLYEFGIVTEQE